MELKEEQNLILRVTKYAIKNKKFKLDEIKTDLEMDEYDFLFLKTTLTSHTKSSENPNHILVAYNMVFYKTSIVPDQDNSEYSLLPNAYYNYVDYLEIKEAKRSSRIALFVSLVALLIAGLQLFLEYGNNKTINSAIIPVIEKKKTIDSVQTIKSDSTKML
ncbi:MAG: hypothetical protein WAU36_06770 [Cyclobacteriaceae bacterium]